MYPLFLAIGLISAGTDNTAIHFKGEGVLNSHSVDVELSLTPTKNDREYEVQIVHVNEVPSGKTDVLGAKVEGTKFLITPTLLTLGERHGPKNLPRNRPMKFLIDQTDATTQLHLQAKGLMDEEKSRIDSFDFLYQAKGDEPITINVKCLMKAEASSSNVIKGINGGVSPNGNGVEITAPTRKDISGTNAPVKVEIPLEK
ncbi:MAG: hypothetical protein JWQ35_351 [Bacteriovoracaceae bacterium]|nr:hypothetical protein [Bacteriovoracaceae bacterium]